MKGKPLYPWAATAVVGIVLMIILSFVGLGQMPVDEEAEADVQPAPEQVAEAGDYGAIYEQSCLACHGEGKMGGDVFGMDAGDVLEAIIEGPGAMPANLVTGEDAEGLAAWIAEQ